LAEGISDYAKRLNHYINFKIEVIPDLKNTKNLGVEQQKQMEGELVLARNFSGKELHLFDEKGKMFTSREFARFLEKKMASGLKELVLVVGGPFGFSKQLYDAAISKISLSSGTFSHQMVRLMCVEQIYRAFTIIKGEPYHHD
ncbi:MAG: 23S rRNA (pseudouridine(1915)-N(3))-methyltransferase RlmH, partial [Bacteroidetes bacterium]